MSNLQAAIDVANAGAASEAIAPAPSSPSPEAAPSTPAPSTPAPEPAPEPAPAVDPDADFIAKLDARKAARQAQGAPDEVSTLRTKLAELEAKLNAPPAAPSHADFATLVRQHGEIEALRMVGIDPLEHFERFKALAKDKDGFARRQAQEAEAARIAKLEEEQKRLGQTWEQQQAAERQRQEQAQWDSYVRMVESPDSGTPLLAKLPAHERVKRTQEKIAELQRSYSPEDIQSITDSQLAKLVERDIRSLRDLLAGTDAGATTTHVPATDGAKRPITASLTNDLASQTTGQTSRPLTEKERLKASIEAVEKGAE